MRFAVLMLISVVCHASLALADCPLSVPAEQRTRIIECTDGSYALQWYSIPSGGWVDYELPTCGMTLTGARLAKESSISVDKATDKALCPPQPKQPAVVVE